jgi:hypothetical protein
MRRGHPELLAVAWLVTGLLLLVGIAGALLVTRSIADDKASEQSVVRFHVASPPRASPPVRITIPAIGVDAAVGPLGLDRAGALQPPRDFADAGWWTGGARPGERGAAVIAGHVDSYTGPAVFFRLGELRRGDLITVERADGSRVAFRVAWSARYPKERFPTAAVYGPTRAPALRLITCSGAFDRARGHYLDNTVVYAAR